MTQFDYDTTIFLDVSKDSLEAALNTLEIFGSVSGLEINMDKSKIVWLGKQNIQRINLKLFTNWLQITPAVKIINKILSSWQRRKVTPIGKLVIKIFVIKYYKKL